MESRETQIDPVALDTLLWAVRWTLYRRYGTHPWWEDLHAEGRLAAYQAVAKAVDPRAALATIACNAAVWACRDWLRSRKNEQRRVSRTGTPLPEVGYWEELFRPEASGAWQEPTRPDFVGDLLTRIEGRRLIGWLEDDPAISGLQVELVWRITLSGERAGVVARELGLGEREERRLRAAALRILRQRQEREDAKDE